MKPGFRSHAIIQERYSWEVGAVRDYLNGPRQHDHYSVWHSFSEWAENNDEALAALSQVAGHEVASADDIQELEPDIFERLPKDIQDEFNAWANGQSNDTLYGSDADAPTWTHMDSGKMLNRSTWLIHFSDHAHDIWKEGFKKGIDDYTRLGLTNHYTDAAKTRGGYCFAFECGSRDMQRAEREGKYGNAAVMFQSAGVKSYHYGDQEHQVIFYGPHVPPGSTIYLYKEDGAWHVAARRGSGNRGWLFRAEKLEDVTSWVEAHYAQYRRSLVSEAQTVISRLLA